MKLNIEYKKTNKTKSSVCGMFFAYEYLVGALSWLIKERIKDTF